ncbi:MAG: glutamine-hydrolyzing carbamoyl-phosphate synthase small subunit [Acidimicrobiales bacterium]|nr:glutamine-hydrolyzing carbamoyl-phosphate synthase small subunit [Acidimicrobiales bacterium]MDG1844786.1 glutamine-hydrolyzing carbamoyl-phosphate synthase small subunit [Acidimicrobiales bacterium]
MDDIKQAALVLADGTIFEGESIGYEPPQQFASGEVVFNTSLTGYQEVITDPSYAGQIITFTYPHIGNYGVTADDYESKKPFCRGIILRDLSRRHSNWRSTSSLDGFLRESKVPGICGIDTRRLTRHIRDLGAMPGAFGTADEATLLAAAKQESGTKNIDLVAEVTCTEPYLVSSSLEKKNSLKRIVALDFGIKTTILKHLSMIGEIYVVPASTPAEIILSYDPDGVFLSNGPGDPAAVCHATETISVLLGQIPIFGICLGHQLLGRAIGASTIKMPFGHHGANHPVKNLASGRIEITSQNHNFAVDADSLNGRAFMTHVNLNDGVCEGMAIKDAPAFSVQHHPEAGPGPHDSTYLFSEFNQLMDKKNGGR